MYRWLRCVRATSYPRIARMKRLMEGVLLLITVSTLSACAETPSGRHPASAGFTSPPPLIGCDETQPSHSLPDPSMQGFAEVWWTDGSIWAAPTITSRGNWYSGQSAQKVGWWRGIKGKLKISGRRLDGLGPPLVADIPEGYGLAGFQASGITLPDPGCWQITAIVGSHVATFVISVKPKPLGPP